MKKISLLLLAVCSLAFIVTSCNKEEESTETIEAFVDQSVIALETRGGLGRGGCFEIVFPVSIAFPDLTTVEVNSYEELRTTIRNWRKVNTLPSGRPFLDLDFVYPMNVINSDGETITLNSRLELFELKRDCIIGQGGLGRPCFKLNFPLSINYPDGTSVAYDTPRLLRNALIEWRKNNNTSNGRPKLAFPISVTMQDGTVVDVASKEELRQLKKDCK